VEFYVVNDVLEINTKLIPTSHFYKPSFVPAADSLLPMVGSK